MPLSKEQYEKVIGRKLTDAEYGKLSGAAEQDRPGDESTFFQPSGINAKAPKGSQNKAAKKEAMGGYKGGVWNFPEGTSKQKVPAGYPALDGGGKYDQGETNVPGTIHNKTLPTEENATAPILAGKGAPSRTYHTSTLGDGVGKPGISNKQSAAKAAPPNLPVVLAGGATPGVAYVGSPDKAPAGTFAPGAPLYTASPAGAPASIGPLPNVPVMSPGVVSGMTNTASPEYAADMGDLYDAIIGDQRKKWGL